MPNTLDNIEVLAAVLRQQDRSSVANHSFRFAGGLLHCPQCGDLRKMNIRSIRLADSFYERGRDVDVESLLPSLFQFWCVQCNSPFTAVGYQGPNGHSLAVFPSSYGGLRTPNTPPGVAYYLDQASRSRSVGALSAAMAMYRGALEHLLFEQGFEKGLCGNKIAALESKIADNSAPQWAGDLDVEVLKALKDLANGALHPNNGDIEKQKALDANLILQVEAVFGVLLFLVYDAPKKKQEGLAAFSKARAVLKK